MAEVNSKSSGVKQVSGSTLVSGSTIRHGLARSSLAFCGGGVGGKAALRALDGAPVVSGPLGAGVA